MKTPFYSLFVVGFCLVGCNKSPEADKPPTLDIAPAPQSELGRDFREAETGSVRGRVRWEGAQPQVEPFKIFAVAGLGREDQKQRPNPHIPRVDAATGGVRQAVVFLKKVDLTKSRPWHHSAVRIEQSQNQLVVHQGNHIGATAFVRRGDSIEVVNRDSHLHSLRVGGADFFNLPLPDKDMGVKRRLEKAGVLDLGDAAGYFWMSGHLFVTDHPYYTWTDSQGHFALEKIPAGEYQLVCWLPNWTVEKSERDPESALVHRVIYRPAVERETSIHITADNEAVCLFAWSLADFAP